jgi:hypothetical protein
MLTNSAEVIRLHRAAVAAALSEASGCGSHKATEDADVAFREYVLEVG